MYGAAKRLLRRLPASVELCLVLTIAFGPFLADELIYPFVAHHGAPISERHLRVLGIHESIVFILLWSFLAIRGWNFRHIGLAPPRASDLLHGIVLFILTYAVVRFFWYGLWRVAPDLVWAVARKPLVAPDLTLLTVVLNSLLNPVFEEVFVCGYLMTALRNRPRLAFNLSVGLRLSYHLYQGAAAVSVIVFGLITSGYYAWRRRLWPLVIAHGLTDFVGLLRHLAQ